MSSLRATEEVLTHVSINNMERIRTSERFIIKDGLIPIPFYTSLITGFDSWYRDRDDGIIDLPSEGYAELSRGPISYSMQDFINGVNTKIIVGNFNLMIIEDTNSVSTLFPDANMYSIIMKSLGKIDVYILGLIKFSGIKKLKQNLLSSYSKWNILIPKEDLVLFVSKNLEGILQGRGGLELKRRLWLNFQRYETEYVSHEYINSFLKPRIHVPTNSLSEYKRIGDEIVTKTFNKLFTEKKKRTPRKKKVVEPEPIVAPDLEITTGQSAWASVTNFTVSYTTSTATSVTTPLP